MADTIHRIIRKFIFLTLLPCFAGFSSNAGTGDTLIVHGFNHFLHQNCNVGDSVFAFPPDSMSFYKIMLRYELSCPPMGCDIYDRIATLKVKKHTGRYDSTLVTGPDYTVDGNTPDSVQFMFDTSYSYTYNWLTQLIDSTPLNPMELILFNDSLHPQLATDTLNVWPAYYNQFIFDSSGVAIDSVFVIPDSVLYLAYDSVYNTFEIVETYEIARSITPYGQGVTLWFDVSDYRTLLHDSVELNSRVCGYSKGWHVTTDFYFIEGIPPMHPYKITNLWNGTWPYGSTTNPIENHLQPITLHPDSQSVYEKIRITTTGHGFGCSPNQDVAEFYDVTHSVIMNGTSFSQRLWRTDCGRNPLYPQGAPGYTSTWFYQRANWCPGSYVKPHDFNATPLLNPGDSLVVNYDMSPYTSSCPSGAYAPEYYIQSHAFFYDNIHYTNNAAIIEVRKPNNAFEYKRMNPVCDAYSPEVAIKNYGKDSLQQLTFHYGVDGNYSSTYTWTGSLKITDTALVELPPVPFTTGSHTFDIYIDQPNSLTDEFAYDDTMHTAFSASSYYNTNYIVYRLLTDNSPAQVLVEVKNEHDSVVYSRNNFSNPSSFYIDTIILPNGCYNFKITDDFGDGICCYDGSGNLKLYHGASPAAMYNGGDYGEFYSWTFTLDRNIGIEEHILNHKIFIFPNPATNKVTLNTSFEYGPVTVEIFDATGRSVSDSVQTEVIGGFAEIDLPSLRDGIYYMRIRNNEDVYSKKLLIGKN